MTTEKIWCGVGQIYTTLPVEAFNQNLTTPAVSIVPCEGCKHPFHSREIARMGGEVRSLADLGLEYTIHLEHYVQVIGSGDKQHVQCSCACEMKKKNV